MTDCNWSENTQDNCPHWRWLVDGELKFWNYPDFQDSQSYTEWGWSGLFNREHFWLTDVLHLDTSEKQFYFRNGHPGIVVYYDGFYHQCLAYTMEGVKLLSSIQCKLEA